MTGVIIKYNMKEGILRCYLTVEAKVDIISWMLRNSAR
jgi:hypothetical protein